MIRPCHLAMRVVCPLALLVCAQTAQAQSTAPPSPSTDARVVTPAAHSAVEVTPFFGLGSSTSTRTGAAVAFVWTPKLRVESELAFRGGGMLCSSVNFMYSLPRIHRVEPYVGAGVGLGHVESAYYSSALPPPGLIISRSIVPFVSAGGGFTVPVRDGIGYRLDFRWSNPQGEHPEAWRVYHGVTLGVGKK
jgi:opacity protein-like surface antigen